MAHHAYLYTGGEKEGIAAARIFAADALGLSGKEHPDITVFSYPGLFSVADARTLNRFVTQAPLVSDKKLVVIATGRIYHEAQNALLKTFEEPLEGTTLVLVVPNEGVLLPTLRSRLLPLPGLRHSTLPEEATAFLVASKTEREKIVTKLLARTKSDKDSEKQAARMEAARIVGGLIVAVHAARREASGAYAEELDLLLGELNRFMPIMHQSSAPLKLIFEHLAIVLPPKL